jgi:hypothetical protein
MEEWKERYPSNSSSIVINDIIQRVGFPSNGMGNKLADAEFIFPATFADSEADLVL